MSFANLERKELIYSNIVQTTPLSCMGLGLYDSKDDGKFIHWLKTHPTLSGDEVVSVNFIDSYATWQNNEVEVDLATLVDDIKIEDVFRINFDSIQVHELDDLIEEGNLTPSL